MKKKLLSVSLVAMIVLSMAGCGNENQQVETTTTDKTNIESTTISTEQILIESDYSHARLLAKYADILAGIWMGGQWPEDINNEYHEELMGDHEENTFAIADVDGDGYEELIVSITNGSMASMSAKVYSYDMENDELIQKLTEFPSLTFYDNGVVFAQWSHNQGYGDIIWPYTVYKYNSNTKKYEYAGSVDSWNKTISDVQYNGDTFPDDIDKDGDGNLFFIGDENNQSSKTVDNVDYDNWVKGFIGDAKEIAIEYKVISYGNTRNYTEDYLKEMAQNLKSENKDAIDIGISVVESDAVSFGISDIVKSLLEDKYNMAFSSNEYEFVGTYNGEEVIKIYTMDVGSVEYTSSVDGLSIFGIYPGMDKDLAVAALSKMNFYEEADDFYVTGDALGNYGIYLQFENDKVTLISFRPSCRYAG